MAKLSVVIKQRTNKNKNKKSPKRMRIEKEKLPLKQLCKGDFGDFRYHVAVKVTGSSPSTKSLIESLA